MSTGYVVYDLWPADEEPDERRVKVVWEQDEADELVRRLNAAGSAEGARWAWREAWVHPEPERDGGYLTASDRDRLLLVRAHDALGSERPVGVFFSFASGRDAALVVASELLCLGWTYAGVDQEAADDELWHCCAHGRRMLVARESIADLRRDMERLAARHGGEYDGWDVSGGVGLSAQVGELAD